MLGLRMMQSFTAPASMDSCPKRLHSDARPAASEAPETHWVGVGDAAYQISATACTALHPRPAAACGCIATPCQQHRRLLRHIGCGRGTLGLKIVQSTTAPASMDSSTAIYGCTATLGLKIVQSTTAPASMDSSTAIYGCTATLGQRYLKHLALVPAHICTRGAGLGEVLDPEPCPNLSRWAASRPSPASHE
jgi:hypothetical protein